MQRPVHSVLLAGITCLSMMCAACGGEGDQTAGADAASGSDREKAADCSAFSQDLLTKYGLQKQLVLNLAMARGRNLKSMQETTGGPEPATFRRLGAGFEGFDWAGIETLPNFDTPDVIARDLGKTADLLQNALAAGDNSADPAWAELSEFYTQKFFVRHNSSISYYLSEAGCV